MYASKLTDYILSLPTWDDWVIFPVFIFSPSQTPYTLCPPYR